MSELARRVSLAGVPMRQQSIWKVENGQPRRKLSVGEAATFARVFGISLSELMTPPGEVAIPSELFQVGRAFLEWRRDAGVLFGRLLDIAEQIVALSPEANFDADTFIKFSASIASDAAEQASQQLGDIEQMIADVRRAIEQHPSPWSFVVSLRDQIAQDGPDGAH